VIYKYFAYQITFQLYYIILDIMFGIVFDTMLNTLIVYNITHQFEEVGRKGCMKQAGQALENITNVIFSAPEIFIY